MNDSNADKAPFSLRAFRYPCLWSTGWQLIGLEALFGLSCRQYLPEAKFLTLATLAQGEHLCCLQCTNEFFKDSWRRWSNTANSFGAGYPNNSVRLAFVSLGAIAFRISTALIDTHWWIR